MRTLCGIGSALGRSRNFTLPYISLERCAESLGYFNFLDCWIDELRSTWIDQSSFRAQSVAECVLKMIACVGGCCEEWTVDGQHFCAHREVSAGIEGGVDSSAKIHKANGTTTIDRSTWMIDFIYL